MTLSVKQKTDRCVFSIYTEQHRYMSVLYNANQQHIDMFATLTANFCHLAMYSTLPDSHIYRSIRYIMS